MTQRRKPELLVILADLLVGVGSRLLLTHAIPGSDVWDDWVPFEDTPIQDYIESQPEQPGPVSPLLCTPFPEVSPVVPTSEFLLPIQGLRRVFGFKDGAIARMVNVSDATLENWLVDAANVASEDRKRVALLAALYTELARHFDGKPYREFSIWLEAGMDGLGGRCPAQALSDGNALAVVNYLALWSARDDLRNQAR
jgi:hypothetical protein